MVAAQQHELPAQFFCQHPDRLKDLPGIRPPIKQITKEDKARASYFNYYTSYKWGKNESYDILIDSSLLGPDGTAELLLDVAKKI